MNLKTFLLAAAALNAVAGISAASAHERKIERDRTCVCTWNSADDRVAPMPPEPPLPPLPPTPPTAPEGYWEMPVPPPGAHVQVFRHRTREGESNVIYRVVREHRDGADANADHKITHREFMERAEKHFKERDKNGDGVLDESEMEVMPFVAPLPPLPPIPPVPPVPPED